MMKLNFESVDEAKQVWEDITGARLEKTYVDNIVEAVTEGLASNSKSVILFEVHVADANGYYQITTPRSQWKGAIEACFNFYEEKGSVDERIDTYLLLKDLEKIAV